MIMTKIFNFIFFFLVVAMSSIAFSSDSLKFAFIIVIVDMIYLFWMSTKNDAKIFEITGVTWLQKKFKNNELIMDMTNE
jgi:hypothetical protein